MRVLPECVETRPKHPKTPLQNTESSLKHRAANTLKHIEACPITCEVHAGHRGRRGEQRADGHGAVPAPPGPLRVLPAQGAGLGAESAEADVLLLLRDVLPVPDVPSAEVRTSDSAEEMCTGRQML